MSNIEERIENLIKKKIEDLNYILYDVQFTKEGQDYYLRIFIEKLNGSIDLNDCEKVNDSINDLIDKADYIKEQYFLEVSSTGLEKILRKDKHLEQNIGKEIEIKLFKPINLNDEKLEENKDENNDNLSDKNLIKNNKKKNNNKKEKNNKQKEIIGILDGFDKDNIKLKIDNRIVEIKRINISQIKTVFNWEELD